MSLAALISSYRVRSALAWLAHHRHLQVLPLVLLGLTVVARVPVPPAVTGPAAVATLVVVLATLAGDHLHDEYDDAGLPCPHCDITADLDLGDARA
ncbi:hypothetical protein M3398_31725 [Streptomyces albidoflavus]|uniref:hypothetical protein n=1 Tax=Streptomyces albidoflavus TaxID=1886 RepID=UPI0020C0811C|nr:hypothetical protein [Streptomyces albidoflavus]MCL6281827.1 hypothetical protein [Streptomyces albidoflavus]